MKKDAAKVTNRGVIIFNKQVVQKYLKGYKYVKIDYNYRLNRLALRPVNTPGKNVVPIRLTRKNKIAIIIQKNLLKKAGANISKGSYYKCTWNKTRKVIIIDYEHPTTRNNLEKENAKKK